MILQASAAIVRIQVLLILLVRTQGQWSKNVKHGRGVFRGSNGKLRNGIWKAGELVKWEGEEYAPPDSA